MGIVQIIDPFYQKLDPNLSAKAPQVGQIVQVVSPHPEVIPRILDVERADPKEHWATKFDIRAVDMRVDFRKKERLPINMLSLGLTEEVLIQTAKLRFAIVLSAGVTIFDDVAKELKTAGRPHLQQPFVMVAPVYGIQTDQHTGGFPPKMVARIRALMYKQFFYCPSKNSPLPLDSVARLDRMHPVLHTSVAGVKSTAFVPTDYALSPEALGVLMGMLRELFGSVDEPDLKTVRDLAMEALPPEAK
jgi:hypothetical protein